MPRQLSAYALHHDDRWWVCLNTPSGLRCRISTSYKSQAAAEAAIVIFGFTLTTAPSHDDVPVHTDPSRIG